MKKNFDERIAYKQSRIKALQKELRRLRVEMRRLEKEREEQTQKAIAKPKKYCSEDRTLSLGKWSGEEENYIESLVRMYWHELVEIHHFDVFPVSEVRFNYSYNPLASCKHIKVVTKENPKRHSEVIITVSRYTYLEGEEFLKNTILHELCHAIKECLHEVHGPKWKWYARKVSALYGTVIKRTGPAPKARALRRKNCSWKVFCEACNATWYYQNKTKFVSAAQRNHAEGWTCGCGAKGRFVAERIGNDGN